MEPNLIVIGGGASGMMAALAAVRGGVKVLLVEGNAELGRKLKATGSGRCNLSNADLGIEHFHGADPAFAAKVLEEFGLEQTLDLFRSLGIYCSSEEGRLYPRSQTAISVRNILSRVLQDEGVEILTSSKVRLVEQRERGGYRISYEHHGGFFIREANAIVLAAGGLAAPELCSDQSVLDALPIRLPISERLPGLVPLRVNLPGFTKLYGVRSPDCCIELLLDGQRVMQRIGELHFSKRALSGIPLLDLSAAALSGLSEGKEVLLRIDLLPDISEAELLSVCARIDGDLEQRVLYLSGLIREPLARLLLEQSLSDLGTAEIAEIRGETFARHLVRLIKDWRLTVQGSLGYAAAQTTSGGIITAALDAGSMALKPEYGLEGFFVAGEIVDIHGDCGGYNLQWAWSSGYLAGKGATRYLASLRN